MEIHRNPPSIRKRQFLTFLGGMMLAGLPSFPVLAQTLPPKMSPQAPSSVIQATMQDLSRRLKIPAQQIRVQQTQAQTWPNGCLGLGKPDELCTQALVPGWQVILGQGNKTWTYRTNQTGSQLRLVSPQPIKSP
ncbi:MAG: hypothetical protein VKK07_13275 [Merismopediaceae bacterium]|nr:hypothetical protein [Merismopediaceae bacterium]